MKTIANAIYMIERCNKIMETMCVVMGVCILVLAIMYLCELIRRKKTLRRINGLIEESNRFKRYYTLLVQWIDNYNTDRKIKSFIDKNGYNSIAIYGASDIGELLYRDLEKSNARVEYFIDKNAKKLMSDIPVYELSEELPSVDIVIITPIYYYSEILNELNKYGLKSVGLDTILLQI